MPSFANPPGKCQELFGVVFGATGRNSPVKRFDRWDHARAAVLESGRNRVFGGAVWGVSGKLLKWQSFINLEWCFEM